jgi:hypothetical protein
MRQASPKMFAIVCAALGLIALVVALRRLVRAPSGDVESYVRNGDAWQLDARVLKWRGVATCSGSTRATGSSASAAATSRAAR